MELTLQTIFKGTTTSISELEVDGVFECDILEDRVRPDGQKVYGQTAIPAGKYQVKLTYSPKFKKVLPEILNVPMFTGIRIHPGNSAKDTEGCLIPGTWDGLNPDWVTSSNKAFDKLYAKLETAEKNNEEITIEIKRDYAA